MARRQPGLPICYGTDSLSRSGMGKHYMLLFLRQNVTVLMDADTAGSSGGGGPNR